MVLPHSEAGTSRRQTLGFLYDFYVHDTSQAVVSHAVCTHRQDGWRHAEQAIAVCFYTVPLK